MPQGSSVCEVIDFYGISEEDLKLYNKQTNIYYRIHKVDDQFKATCSSDKSVAKKWYEVIKKYEKQSLNLNGIMVPYLVLLVKYMAQISNSINSRNFNCSNIDSDEAFEVCSAWNESDSLLSFAMEFGQILPEFIFCDLIALYEP